MEACHWTDPCLCNAVMRFLFSIFYFLLCIVYLFSFFRICILPSRESAGKPRVFDFPHFHISLPLTNCVTGWLPNPSCLVGETVGEPHCTK